MGREDGFISPFAGSPLGISAEEGRAKCVARLRVMSPDSCKHDERGLVKQSPRNLTTEPNIECTFYRALSIAFAPLRERGEHVSLRPQSFTPGVSMKLHAVGRERQKSVGSYCHLLSQGSIG